MALYVFYTYSRAPALRATVAVRPFSSVDDLAVRVRELRKDELNRLAEIGALNALDQQHRRDALWQAQRAILPVGPLLAPLEETGEPSPLALMSTEERLWADYRGTGVTVGKHRTAWSRRCTWRASPTAASCASPAVSSCASGRAPPRASSSSAWKTKPA